MTTTDTIIRSGQAPDLAGFPDALRVTALTKTYGRGDAQVRALRNVDLSFRPASFTAVMGPSGCGKSTFLHTSAGLDTPTSGSVTLDGIELTTMNEVALTKLRRQRIGFVFQAFNLLPALTVHQNILLPARLSGTRPDKPWVREVIERTRLTERVAHRPAQLSGGQQQRVAIARALVMRPVVLFADEPTGALDSRSSRDVLLLLRDCVDRDGLTIVMVTHDPVAAAHADAVVFLADGSVADHMQDPTPERVADRLIRLGE